MWWAFVVFVVILLVCVCVFFSRRLVIYMCIGACWGFCGCTNQRISTRGLYIHVRCAQCTHIYKFWSCKMAMLHILCIIDETPSTASHVHGMTHVIRGDYSTLFVWPTSTCSDLCAIAHQYIILWLCLSPLLIQNLNWKLNLILFMCMWTHKASDQRNLMKDITVNEWMKQWSEGFFFISPTN